MLVSITEEVEPDFDDVDVPVLSADGGMELGHWLTGTFEAGAMPLSGLRPWEVIG